MTAEASSWTLPNSLSNYLAGETYFVYGVAFWLALVQVSIAASQIVLGILVLIWVYRIATKQVALVHLPIDIPILLYAGLSLTAALSSFHPIVSLAASKKLLLLLVPYLLVSSLRRKETLSSLVIVVVVMADLGALVGLWQYRFGTLGGLNDRIHGFVGHYMTYAGLLMAVAVLATAHALYVKKHRGFLLVSLALILPTLILTLTRSAWIGTLVAMIVLLFLRDRRLLALVPAGAVVVGLLLPRAVERRMGSFASPDASGWDRVYMLRAGAAMIGNHPLFGVGPEMVAEVYPIYVVPEANQRENPHLHNNLVQIAAERGIPCAIAWLWVVTLGFGASVVAYRRAADDPLARALSAGAMGVVLSGFVAGLFEFNFGDSEFQMLFLFAMSLPWILERARP